MFKTLRASLALLVVFTLLLGLAYPAAVWVAGQLFFSHEADGSLVSYQGKIIGSALIGQNFTGERYFWPRPSSGGHPYAFLSSGASNLNPANPALIDQIRKRIAFLSNAHENQNGTIPADLVTASGSGLDPHISPAAALYQAARVAKARGLPLERVHALIQATTENRTLGILGEPRVHVLLLNLALDRLSGGRP
ncbi:MAG: potassium-transporting ATPase subunit KdpC [Bdellovibrionales bacterium]|jgi:K+-transporting ATPase ATPase C chain